MAVLSFPLLPATLPDSLSEAEQKVALGLIAGKSTAEIAAERRTSVRTVANQIASLFAKLGVRSRLQLAALGGRTLRG